MLRKKWVDNGMKTTDKSFINGAWLQSEGHNYCLPTASLFGFLYIYIESNWQSRYLQVPTTHNNAAYCSITTPVLRIP